jgi:hydrogenase maturation protein HypF
LRPFLLPGGETAIRQPGRVAASLLSQVLSADELTDVGRRVLAEPVTVDSLLAVMKSTRLSPTTTSAGRLFDGVASLILGLRTATYEGQPAIHLEEACDEAETGAYPFPVTDGELLEIDWRPALRQLLEDLRSGVEPSRIAMRFHRGLAEAVAEMSARFPADPVVLGGGVFQNRILVEEIAQRLPPARIGLPGRIPPNDGGLAAGQLAIAAHVLPSLRLT